MPSGERVLPAYHGLNKKKGEVCAIFVNPTAKGDFVTECYAPMRPFFKLYGLPSSMSSGDGGRCVVAIGT